MIPPAPPPPFFFFARSLAMDGEGTSPRPESTTVTASRRGIATQCKYCRCFERGTTRAHVHRAPGTVTAFPHFVTVGRVAVSHPATKLAYTATKQASSVKPCVWQWWRVIHAVGCIFKQVLGCSHYCCGNLRSAVIPETLSSTLTISRCQYSRDFIILFDRSLVAIIPGT